MRFMTGKGETLARAMNEAWERVSVSLRNKHTPDRHGRAIPYRPVVPALGGVRSGVSGCQKQRLLCELGRRTSGPGKGRVRERPATGAPPHRRWSGLRMDLVRGLTTVRRRLSP